MIASAPLPDSQLLRNRRQFRWRATIAMAVCLVVLAGLGLYTPLGQSLDTVMMAAIASLEMPQFATITASIPLLVVLAALVATIAIVRRRYALAFRALVVIAGANGTTQLLKLLLIRPYFGVGFDLENSFPSGHATFAASLGIALIVVAPAGWRLAAAFVSTLWIASMGFTVVQLGWHRPSDVLGAICVCVWWGMVLAPVEERQRRFPLLRKLSLIGGQLLLEAALVLTIVGAVGGYSDLRKAASFYEFSALPGTWAGGCLVAAVVLWIVGAAGVGCLLVDRLCAAPSEFTKQEEKKKEKEREQEAGASGV